MSSHSKTTVFGIFVAPPTFDRLQAAVIAGNHALVADFLSQAGCQIADPLEDRGYTDEDGYNPTVLHSLLYDAVSFPAVLKVLLRDGRFDPKGVDYDAFYQCLNLGAVESLKCFVEDGRFLIPAGTLKTAAELGGDELMDYLLTVPAIVGNPVFSSEMDAAFQISAQNKDKKIVKRFLECYQQRAIPIPENLRLHPVVQEIITSSNRSYDFISDEVIGILNRRGIPETVARKITHSFNNQYVWFSSTERAIEDQKPVPDEVVFRF